MTHTYVNHSNVLLLWRFDSSPHPLIHFKFVSSVGIGRKYEKELYCCCLYTPPHLRVIGLLFFLHFLELCIKLFMVERRSFGSSVQLVQSFEANLEV